MDVDESTIAKSITPQRAFCLKAEFSIEPDGWLVISPDTQFKTGEIEPAISQVDQGFHERRSDTFSLPFIMHAHANTARVFSAR